MVVTIPLDVEAVTSAYLRADAAVTALVADRVYTAIPAKAVYPLVRILRIDSGPIDTGHPLVLEEVDLQIDVFGGSKKESLRIAETARGTLYEMVGLSNDGADGNGVGVVADIVRSGVGYLEDPDQQPPRPRYVVQATVTTRHGNG